ncbi:MAG TPA: signal peptide peptidase SppA [Xanthobacteraceae bacterium]|nr:signal peptide peptidase SppA [Xanthobacteraceae bacterium]
MSLDADLIVDRRRMRRKLTFWRVAAIVVAIIAIIVAAGKLAPNELGEVAGAQIARVTITGLIRGDRDRVEALQKLAKASYVKAVIIHVDSPGGTTAGSQQLHDALRGVAAKKPTVVVIDGLGASGAYIAAMASDHIVAEDTSLVGSIGVLFQYPNFAQVLDKVGVKVETVRSTPLKASPNGFEPTPPEATAALDAIVKDSYAWFRGMVQDRRKLTAAELDKVADGRVFTGRQALGLKLIDQIGDEQTAIDWLAKSKGIDANLPVKDWRLEPRLSELPFLHAAAAAALEAVGLKSLARRFEDTGAMRGIESLNLDGLLALWHPSGTN